MGKKEKGTLISTAFQAILDSTRDMMFIKDADLVYAAVCQNGRKDMP